MALTSVCMARSGGGQVFERRGLAADVVEIGRVGAVPVVGFVRNALQDHHQAFQPRQGDGLPQQRIANAEYSGGGADPERQREHGDDGEAGRFTEHAFSVTDVLPKTHEIKCPRKEYAGRGWRVRTISPARFKTAGCK
ncbi:MAG: hypothetical protein NTW28_11345 [Candidatus Solibacter sp.]|nr:hypothetical protein [Candidatus Solibacter sp.]